MVAEAAVVRWGEGEEQGEKLTAWRLCETYLRESNLAPDSKPEAVEVPVEADLSGHGLPKLIGILDLVQHRKIIDYKTASTTPKQINTLLINFFKKKTNQ